MDFYAGQTVEILMSGEWFGPFTVTAHRGRTEYHLVLFNPTNRTHFEHYADPPYNVRAV